MTTSLIISTYNSPEYLRLTLLSLMNQHMLPDEVIIADDGSGEETRILVTEMQERTKNCVPIKHVWHEDRGFRKSEICNKAFATAESDYIIQIDGDIVMHPYFVYDHVRYAETGTFVCGSRTLLTPQLTAMLIQSQSIKVNWLNKGVRHRLNAMRLPLLTPCFYGYKANNPLYMRGCNFAVWRKDLFSVNGYNESITGWGREDSELAVRLCNAGLVKRFLKYAAVQYHLFHKENSKEYDDRNYGIMLQAKVEHVTHVANGIVKD